MALQKTTDEGGGGGMDEKRKKTRREKFRKKSQAVVGPFEVTGETDKKQTNNQQRKSENEDRVRRKGRHPDLSHRAKVEQQLSPSW